MPPGGGKRPVEARVSGIRDLLFPQHQPDPNCSLRFGPVRQDLIHSGIGGIDRLNDPESLRILGIDVERIARVVAVEIEGGDNDRGIDADRVHGRYHFLTGCRCRAVELSGPRPTGMVAFVGVYLDIDYRHRSILCYRAASRGGVPSRSAPVPSTRSTASAIVSSFSSARAGAVSCSPTGMPARSRPTGIVTAQRPR